MLNIIIFPPLLLHSVQCVSAHNEGFYLPQPVATTATTSWQRVKLKVIFLESDRNQTHTHMEDGFFLTILLLLLSPLGLHKRLVKSMCSVRELRIDFEFYRRNRFNCHGSRTLFYFHYSYFSSSMSIPTFIYSYILRSFFSTLVINSTHLSL